MLDLRRKTFLPLNLPTNAGKNDRNGRGSVGKDLRRHANSIVFRKSTGLQDRSTSVPLKDAKRILTGSRIAGREDRKTAPRLGRVKTGLQPAGLETGPSGSPGATGRSASPAVTGHSIDQGATGPFGNPGIGPLTRQARIAHSASRGETGRSASPEIVPLPSRVIARSASREIGLFENQAIARSIGLGAIGPLVIDPRADRREIDLRFEVHPPEADHPEADHHAADLPGVVRHGAIGPAGAAAPRDPANRFGKTSSGYPRSGGT